MYSMKNVKGWIACDKHRGIIDVDCPDCRVEGIVVNTITKDPVSKVQCPYCGWVRFIWSWTDGERDRVWDWLKSHNEAACPSRKI